MSEPARPGVTSEVCVTTSPDHGVGYDIAGRGLARPDSLIAAIRMASTLATTRERSPLATA